MANGFTKFLKISMRHIFMKVDSSCTHVGKALTGIEPKAIASGWRGQHDVQHEEAAITMNLLIRHAAIGLCFLSIYRYASHISITPNC